MKKYLMGKMLYFTISAVQKSVRKRVHLPGERLVECLMFILYSKKRPLRGSFARSGYHGVSARAGFSENLSPFFEIVQSVTLNIFLLQYVT